MNVGMLRNHTNPPRGTAAARVGYLALFDPVTGLPGPELLLDRVNVALARARRTGRRVGVFAFCGACRDTDDAAVRELVSRLCDEVRADDTVARVTDRTFFVVCNDIEFDQDAGAIVGRLLKHVAGTCRYGVALGSPFDDARELLARAAHRATPPLADAA
jgi:GGDEF domain-containing protein